MLQVSTSTHNLPIGQTEECGAANFLHADPQGMATGEPIKSVPEQTGQDSALAEDPADTRSSEDLVRECPKAYEEDEKGAGRTRSPKKSWSLPLPTDSTTAESDPQMGTPGKLLDRNDGTQ